MERETKTIKLPLSKMEAVLKTYLTGGEKRQIRNVFLNDAEFTSKGDQQELGGIKGSVVEQAENKAIEIVVVSVDSKTDGILAAILELHSKDYDFIIEAINKITADEDFLGEGGK